MHHRLRLLLDLRSAMPSALAEAYMHLHMIVEVLLDLRSAIPSALAEAYMHLHMIVEVILRGWEEGEMISFA